MTNRFLVTGQAAQEQSRLGNVYACLESAEQIGPDGGDILSVWDAIDAEWYEQNRTRLTKRDLLEQVPIYRFEITFSPYVSGLTSLRKVAQDSLQPGYDDALRWFKIQFGQTAIETVATFYSSLLGDGTTRYINKHSRLPEALDNQLTKTFSLDDLKAVTVDDVCEFLDGFGQIHHLIAYDVGQGVAIGLCDAAGAVRAYADAGAGTLANKKTFPSALKSFCFGESPGVILSHWDSDHWAAAVRDERFTHLPWLVPYQKTRPSHRAMAHEINKNGRLLIWPTGEGKVARGQVEIEKCSGSSRNGSGLAVTVWRDSNRTADRVLIPGDADYHLIPSFQPGSLYYSVVVPHHGGRLLGTDVPSPANGKLSRAIYSYGPGNSYKHPHADTLTSHHRAGWTDSVVAPAAGLNLARRTEKRCPTSDLGHTFVAWDTRPGIRCGSSKCQLESTQ